MMILTSAKPTPFSPKQMAESLTWFSCTRATTLSSTSGLQKGLKPSGMSAPAPSSCAAPAPARGGKADVLATIPILCKGRTHLRHRTAVPFCSLLLAQRRQRDVDGSRFTGEAKGERVGS